MINTSLLRRITRFAAKPWWRKFQSLGFRWIRYFPGIPLPLRLPFGAWWLVENDFAGAGLLDGRFEEAERAFVARFLEPGMTVLDIGAHKGLYSLLSAFKVSSSGRVFAFEPSPRERKRLKQHLRLNRCHNVCVLDFALGDSEGGADLFVVRGTETGCNSLRRPDVAQPVEPVHVSVKVLDEVLREQGVSTVDFIKLDVEGAELSVLKGAAHLLGGVHRPVILCEVQDQRTKPWGYAAAEILSYLSELGYEWFEVKPAGQMEKVSLDCRGYDGNFVAIPQERIASLSHFISNFEGRNQADNIV